MKEKVVSVEQMRKSDAYTIEHAVSGRVLMYRAAMGVFDSYGNWYNKQIAIITGGGNNGGDGYALAGILKEKGIDPIVLMVSDNMSDDGKYYFEIADKAGVKFKKYSEETDLCRYDVIVDCILGTGFRGEVREPAKNAIEAINNSGAFVISVDINSGMNGDNGEAILAVKSDLTVSIGFIKKGLVTEKANKYIKKLVNVDIGILLV